MAPKLDKTATTALALGNPIWGDDGVGAELLSRLEQEPVPGTHYVDGGTADLGLLPTIRQADRLLLLDALAGPGTAGTVLKIAGPGVFRSGSGRGVAELLSTARLLGQCPQQITVIGVVARSLGPGIGLSPAVAAAVPKAAAAAQEVLRRWQRC